MERLTLLTFDMKLHNLAIKLRRRDAQFRLIFSFRKRLENIFITQCEWGWKESCIKFYWRSAHRGVKLNGVEFHRIPFKRVSRSENLWSLSSRKMLNDLRNLFKGDCAIRTFRGATAHSILYEPFTTLCIRSKIIFYDCAIAKGIDGGLMAGRSSNQTINLVN